MRHHLKSKVVKGGQGGRANPSRNPDHHPPFIGGGRWWWGYMSQTGNRIFKVVVEYDGFERI